MSRKQLWIGIGMLVVVLGGYWGYRWWKAPARSPWEIIPSDALLVLESTALQDTIPRSVQLSEMSLRNTPVFQEAARSLEQFIWAPLDTADAMAFLHEKPIWYSLHPTSKNRMGFIFYIPIRSLKDRSLADQIRNPDADRFRVLVHSYEGERIHELLTVQNVSLGSFLVMDDYLIGSPSSILIESVIRRIRLPFAETLLQRADVSLLRPNTVAGLYVRSTVLSALFSRTEDKATDWQTQYIRAFLPSELLTHFRRSNSRTHLIGLSTDEIGTKTSLGNLFAGQTPTRIKCSHLIPNRTSTLYHIGISDGPRFGAALTSFINSDDDPTIREGRRKLRPLLQNEQNGFYRYVGNEITLLRMDAPSSDRRLVLLIHSSNIERLADRYQLAALLASGKDRIPTSKPFLRYRTSLVDSPELPAFLFSGLFRGFDRSWVSQVGNYMIVANSEGVLQEFLQSVEQKTVWEESSRQRDLIKQTLRPANFTAYTRFDRAGGSIADRWPTAWQQFLKHSDSALDNVENLVYQSSYGKERIYSTLVLGRATRRASDAVFNRVFLQKKIDLNASPLSSPMVLGDFLGGSGQIWLVDNNRQFMQINPDGEKLPIQSVDGPVRSQLVPVDFLNNGRLQYAFTTDRSLYIVDPVGNRPRLQSVPLPTGVLPAILMAPRRDQNRALLLLMTHQDGSVFGYDKRQRRFVRQFGVTGAGEGVGNFRAFVRNQLLSVVSLQKEGRLNLWYEDGARANGFPVDLKAEFMGPAWMDAGESGVLTAMSRQGELIRVGEDGQILERTQLVRPIRRGSFRLLPEQNQHDYLLLRTSDTEVAFLDHQGKLLFQVRSLLPGKTTIRYHVLGSGLSLVSIKSGNFTTLYNLQGRPVGDRPVPSLYPVELEFSGISNKLFVYGNTDKALQVWSIKIR